MFSLREWGVLYGIVGLAYSLLQSWRYGSFTFTLTREIKFVALCFFFWPWAMISTERYMRS